MFGEWPMILQSVEFYNKKQEIEENGRVSVIIIMLYFTEGDIFTRCEDTEILMVKWQYRWHYTEIIFFVLPLNIHFHHQQLFMKCQNERNFLNFLKYVTLWRCFSHSQCRILFAYLDGLNILKHLVYIFICRCYNSLSSLPLMWVGHQPSVVEVQAAQFTTLIQNI